jgi:hypothetical protein
MDNGGISAVETPHQHTRLITKSPLSRRAKQRKEKKIVETALVKRLNKRLVRPDACVLDSSPETDNASDGC